MQQILKPQMKERNIIGTILSLIAVIIAFRNWIYTPSSIIFISITSIIICSYLLIRKKISPTLNLILLPFLFFSLLSLILSSTKNVGLAETTLDLSLFTLLISLSAIKLPSLQKILAPTIIIQLYFATTQVLTSTTPRAAGTFLNWSSHTDLFPNALGLFCISIIPILAHKKNSLINYILLTATFITLFLSYSRGATLTLTIGLLILTGFHLFKKQKNKIFKNIGCLLAAILITFSLTQIRISKNLPTNDLATKATFSDTEQTTSVNERQQFLKNTWSLIPEKPLLGYGPSSFPYIFPQVQDIPLSNSLHPHNWILKIFVERGPLTLLGFVLFLIFTLKKVISKFPEKIALFASLTAIFLHNSIDFNLNLPLNFFILILILAKALHTSSPQKPNSASQLIYLLTILTTAIITFQLFQTHQIYAKGFHSNEPATQIAAFKKIDYLDSSLRLADAYITTDKNQEAVETLQSHLQSNPFNYFATNKIGNLKLWNNQQADSIPYFIQTIELDPKNFVNPYKSLVQAINQTDPTLINEHQETILKFLEEYHWAAKLNLHFTAQSNQIDEAIELCDLLLENPNTIEPEKIEAIKSDLQEYKIN